MTLWLNSAEFTWRVSRPQSVDKGAGTRSLDVVPRTEPLSHTTLGSVGVTGTTVTRICSRPRVGLDISVRWTVCSRPTQRAQSVTEHVRRVVPQGVGDSDFVYRQATAQKLLMQFEDAARSVDIKSWHLRKRSGV